MGFQGAVDSRTFFDYGLRPVEILLASLEIPVCRRRVCDVGHIRNFVTEFDQNSIGRELRSVAI